VKDQGRCEATASKNEGEETFQGREETMSGKGRKESCSTGRFFEESSRVREKARSDGSCDKEERRGTKKTISICRRGKAKTAPARNFNDEKDPRRKEAERS